MHARPHVVDLLLRIWDHIEHRINGPLHLRFIVQPAMAMLVAIRVARRPPAERTDGWRDIAAVWMVAACIDAIYQVVMFRWLDVGETVLIASLLSLAPYILLSESMKWWTRRRRCP